ncbi:MAG: chromosome partitioning protein ParA [Planctomycetaceae bacterium]|nr:chromosome partitioning protein ParA [Planctomycetaceae bacterium]
MLIAFANSKGGVGKSTLAVHLAVWLHDHGRSVALLDVDKQRSSSTWVAEAEPKMTVRTAETHEEIAASAHELAETHEFIVADAPGGLEELSRTVLILAHLAVFPVLPSILDLRSVAEATKLLKFAQGINGGRPEGKLILNRLRKRDRISRELLEAAPALGLSVAHSTIRDLQAFRLAAQQGTVVTRMGARHRAAATEVTQLLVELLTDKLVFADKGSRGKTLLNQSGVGEEGTYGKASLAE